MIDFIANEVKRILIQCCDRHAKENNIKVSDVQMNMKLNIIETDDAFGIDNENPNRYVLCENYKPKKELTIWQVLNLPFPKLDFKNYAGLSQPFIFKALTRFAEKHNIDYNDVAILCFPNDNKKDMDLAIYNKYEFVKEIKFSPKEEDSEDCEYLFNPEDIEILQNQE